MRIKIFIMGLVCLILISCATAPVPRQIVNTFPIEKPFDLVWQAVVESFAELQLPIQNMEKDSGLITTDWIDFPLGKKGMEFCDCGGLGMNIEEQRMGRFNVFVKKNTEDSCEIKVNCMYQQIYRAFSMDANYTPSATRRNCVSTGKLETDIFNSIKAKLNIK